MSRVDRREPNAQREQRKGDVQPEPFAQRAVEHGDQWIGRVQRGNGGEDVGILRVHRREDIQSRYLIEVNEASRIAHGLLVEFEPVGFDVPRRPRERVRGTRRARRENESLTPWE